MRCDDITEGGPPGYVGLVKQDEYTFGDMKLIIESWPDYRIGSIAWPSAMLLARALAEGAEFLPAVKGMQVAELGAGPGLPALVCGRLGAAGVAITDRAELVPLIERNIELNDVGGNCRGEALDWVLAFESALGAAKRAAAGAEKFDVLLAADVVYFEEQEPLIEALSFLMVPEHTVLVLAYRERTDADRRYLNERILPSLLDAKRYDYSAGEAGSCEIYIGKRRSS